MGKLDIPRDFYKFPKRVTLCADMMFVSGLPFLVTSPQNTIFVTTEFVPKHGGKFVKHLRKVLKLYAQGGFVVDVCHMDQEFIKVRDFVGTLEVNTTAAREHVGKIERFIRLLKERL